MRRALVVIGLAAAAALASPTAASAALPPVKHVFIIVLENENASDTFGPSTQAPYLARALTAQGQFVPNYYAVTHLSLGNYIALVSGQGSNPYTQADAPAYIDFTPGVPGPDGQALGQGSVYPASVKTIADQLTEKGLGWKGYMEDMGNAAPAQPATCRHPPSAERLSRTPGGSSPRTSSRHAGPALRGRRPTLPAAGRRPTIVAGPRRPGAGTVPCWCRPMPGLRWHTSTLSNADSWPERCRSGQADSGASSGGVFPTSQPSGPRSSLPGLGRARAPPR